MCPVWSFSFPISTATRRWREQRLQSSIHLYKGLQQIVSRWCILELMTIMGSIVSGCIEENAIVFVSAYMEARQQDNCHVLIALNGSMLTASHGIISQSIILFINKELFMCIGSGRLHWHCNRVISMKNKYNEKSDSHSNNLITSTRIRMSWLQWPW